MLSNQKVSQQCFKALKFFGDGKIPLPEPRFLYALLRHFDRLKLGIMKHQSETRASERL